MIKYCPHCGFKIDNSIEEDISGEKCIINKLYILCSNCNIKSTIRSYIKYSNKVLA